MLRLLRISFWLACGAVAVLSLMPITALPVGVFDWWDKAQHALAFAVLSIFGRFSYPSSRFPVLIGLIAFGAAIEVAQAATGWRYGEWGDLLADAIGVFSGWLLARVLVRGLNYQKSALAGRRLSD